MHFSPLVHGAFGILDEVIIAVQALLVIALVISFIRARRKHKSRAPEDSARTGQP